MASRSVSLHLFVLTVVLLLAGAAAQAQAPSTTSPTQGQATPGVAPRLPAAPEPSEPEWRLGAMTFGADTSVTTAYVWRGWILDTGRCLQPDVWVKMGDLTVTSWVNVHMMSGTSLSLTEHDLSVDYSHEAGRVTLSAGWINYATLGHQAGNTNEFYGGLRLKTLFNPGVQVYHDVQLGNGTYVSLSANQGFPIVRRVGGTAQVSVGYNHHQYTEVSGWSDVAVTLKLNVEVPSARVTLQPTIAYSHSLLPDVFPSRVFGGLSVAFK